MKKLILLATTVAFMSGTSVFAADNLIDLMLNSPTPVIATSQIDALGVGGDDATYDLVAAGNIGGLDTSELVGNEAGGTNNSVVIDLDQVLGTTATGAYDTVVLDGARVAAVQQAMGNSMNIEQLIVSDTGTAGVNAVTITEDQGAAVLADYSAITSVGLTGEEASNTLQAVANGLTVDGLDMDDAGAAGSNAFAATLNQGAPVTARLATPAYTQSGLTSATSIVAAGNNASLKNLSLNTN